MRNFNIIEVLSNDNYELIRNDLFLIKVQLEPILSKIYNINNKEFRCIEHKTGEVLLLNNDFTLKLREIY
jgi:hypothetical protein